MSDSGPSIRSLFGHEPSLDRKICLLWTWRSRFSARLSQSSGKLRSASCSVPASRSCCSEARST